MVGCAKMGLNFTACAPRKYQPDAALVEQCRAIAAETGASCLRRKKSSRSNGIRAKLPVWTRNTTS